jgi:hypothetical protein
MIEVSLYSITGRDVNVSMGKCVDRARLNKTALGVDTMEFIKGFLKQNVASIELALKNPDIINFINDDATMTFKDFASLNYWLAKSGYLVKVFNVTDDEENPTGPAPEVSEWNVIDYNFYQNGFPTAIKIVPADGADVVEILKQVVNDSGLFDKNKLGNTKNPLTEYIELLEKSKKLMGKIEPGAASKIYDILDQVGVKLFLAVGE